MTITEFLEARIAEDEALASAFPGKNWRYNIYDIEDDAQIGFLGAGNMVLDVGYDGGYQQGFIEHAIRHDPARVLAECTAKRKLLSILENGPEVFDGERWVSPLKVMAAVYADHSEYRQEWAL